MVLLVMSALILPVPSALTCTLSLPFEPVFVSRIKQPVIVTLSGVLIDELGLAIDELPNDQPYGQREVFIRHELEGQSFKEMAAESGINLNTLLARKRYAVLHLRERLQSIYDEFIGGG